MVHVSYGTTDAMHGVIYFKALDDSAFFAANSIMQGVHYV